MTRKGYQVQVERRKKADQLAKEKISAQIKSIRREIRDTEDQKKTVSSDKTEYLEKGFAAFSSGCVVCGYFAHTVTSVMIPSAPAEVYLAFSSGNWEK